jgi:hypothetical protein
VQAVTTIHRYRKLSHKIRLNQALVLTFTSFLEKSQSLQINKVMMQINGPATIFIPSRHRSAIRSSYLADCRQIIKKAFSADIGTERGVLDRVLARLRKIPLSNWPVGLLGTHPGTVLLLRTAADAEVDPSAVYELAYSVATTLAKILTAFSDNEIAVNEQMYVWLPRPFVRVAVSIDANGRVRTVPTGDFSQFLRDLELVDDVRRFRQCPLCPRYFFAERSDQTACSRSHAKTLSMQKWATGPRQGLRAAAQDPPLGTRTTSCSKTSQAFATSKTAEAPGTKRRGKWRKRENADKMRVASITGQTAGGKRV